MKPLAYQTNCDNGKSPMLPDSDSGAGLMPPDLLQLIEMAPGLAKLLMEQPRKGTGHTWLFRVALRTRGSMTREACFRLLRECADTWERHVPDSEIVHAISAAYAPKTDTDTYPAVKWPEPEAKAIESVLVAEQPIFGLSALDMDGYDVLAAYFSEDELLCVGKTKSCAVVQHLASLKGETGKYQFLVPSPMLGRSGVNRAGKESARCLANTGPRRLLVVEFDGASKQDQCKLLTRLNSILPLSFVVDSGRKSLHGFFHCQDIPESELQMFMQYAVWLGADPHTWTRSQWVRMPGGIRIEPGSEPIKQSILYYADHKEVA